MIGTEDSSGGGVVSVLGTTLFVVTLIASIGVYGYEKYLEGAIAGMDTKLEEARNSLDPDLIKKLTQTNSQFVSASALIAQHQVPSSFLDLLSKVTLKTVRFLSLGYETDKDGIVSIKMKGSARSYATIAAQAKVMNDEPLLISPQFSNLDLNKEGDVTFDFKASVDKKAISYEKKITDTTGNAPVATPSSVATTTPPVATTTSAIPATTKKTTTAPPTGVIPSSPQQ